MAPERTCRRRGMNVPDEPLRLRTGSPPSSDNELCTLLMVRKESAGTELEKETSVPATVVGRQEVSMNAQPTLTLHATDRCRNRGIPTDAVNAAIEFGKHRAIRGADVYTLGWREVRFYADQGIDLSRWEGIEVVCAHDGHVLTVYRNKNPRALRDRAALRRVA